MQCESQRTAQRLKKCRDKHGNKHTPRKRDGGPRHGGTLSSCNTTSQTTRVAIEKDAVSLGGFTRIATRDDARSRQHGRHLVGGGLQKASEVFVQSAQLRFAARAKDAEAATQLDQLGAQLELELKWGQNFESRRRETET